MENEEFRMLVVDDEKGVVDVMVKTLKQEFSSEVMYCTDPQKAIEIAGKHEIAILFTELKMQVMDGLTLAAKIQKVSPNTICIMLTGWATKDVLIQALNEGVIWRCLEKPCPVNKLTKVVNEAMDAFRSKVSAASKRKSSRFRVVGEKKEENQHEHKIKIKRPRRTDKDHRKAARIITGKRYRDLEQIAHGGSGIIYKAMDTLLDMPVAIKVLAPHLTKDTRALEGLFAEARIAMQLSHKHIVRLHNIEEVHNSHYLVMEYINGVTLRDMLEECRKFPVETIHQIAQICDDAIGYAHRREVYHRDLKPENFMLRDDDMLKIIDFGLACLSEKSAGSNIITGTPFYVSPEELRNEKIDQRSDLFSLAVVFHELLTGNIPFRDDQNEETDMEDFVATPAKYLPHDLRKVFERAFESDPDDRYDDIHDFIKAFRKTCLM